MMLRATALAFTAVLAAIALTGCPSGGSPVAPTATGTEFVYAVDHVGDQTTPEGLAAAIRRRIDPDGRLSAIVEPIEGGTHVRIFLPGAGEDEAARVQRLIERSGHMTFHVCVLADEEPEWQRIAEARLEGDNAPGDYAWLPLKWQADENWDRVREMLFGLQPVERTEIIAEQAEGRFRPAMGGQAIFVIRDSGDVELLVRTDLPEVTGADFAEVRGDFHSQMGTPVISFSTTPDGGERLARLTGANIGSPLAIALDGRIQSAPILQDALRERGMISGYQTASERDEVLAMLQSGTFDATLTLQSIARVEPMPARP